MKRTFFVAMLIGAVAAFLVIGGCAQEKKAGTAESSQGQQTPAQESAAATQAPSVTVGKVLVDEEILSAFVAEPNHHFGLAREAFLRKDYAKASAELLTCAGFVKLESMRASGDDRRMLEDAVIRLAEIADAIKAGQLASVDKLDSAYARAELALASHHEIKAQELWKAENPKSAGQDLKAASLHLDNSMKYAGEKTEADAKAVIDDASDIGQKLIAGTALAADKVGKGMQDLGAKIEEWGKKTMAPKK